MTSVSANYSSLASMAQYAQSLLTPPSPSTAAATPDPYGTATQSYQEKWTANYDSQYSYNLSNLGTSAASGSGDPETLFTVGQALKAATSVDPVTGVSEINAGALTAVAKALEWSFDGLLNQTCSNQSAAVYTNTGGLSKSDVATAVAQAVKQFASGQNGGAFTLSLSTVQGSVFNASGSSAGQLGIGQSFAQQDVQVVRNQSTYSITLGADGKLSSSFTGTTVGVEDRNTTENGAKGADATLDSGWLVTNSADINDPMMTVAQAVGGSPDDAGFDSGTIAFALASHTVFQPAAGQGQMEAEIIDRAQQGVVSASTGYGPKGISFAQEGVLNTLTTVEQAYKDAATGGLTAKVSVTNTLALSLLTLKGQPVFLYTRPDGTLGRFAAGGLNTIT